MPPMPVEDIADFVENLQTAKFDEYVPTGLLRRLWARMHTDPAAAIRKVAQGLMVGAPHRAAGAV